jgi:hypothetical protein
MYKSKKHGKSRRRTYKNRTRRNYPKFKKSKVKARGLSADNINCCMCDHQVSKKDTFMPLACKQKYGFKAHRICNKCWWEPNTGFARENAPHGCPGCERGLPLNPSPKKITPKSAEIIVISD